MRALLGILICLCAQQALADTRYVSDNIFTDSGELKAGESWKLLNFQNRLLENQEIEMIKSVLKKYNGHREKSAQELGISKRTLQNKLNRFNLRSL